MDTVGEVKLWLDDLRTPPPGWTWAKTFDEAVEILKTGLVVAASLDHDLGLEKTGYDVVCWMEENDVWPKNGVSVHSMNPVGRAKMQVVIENNYSKED